MEETNEYFNQDNGGHLSSARGGPIFVSNHVGPMTSVPDFKASLLQELRDLEAELVLADDFDEELAIDDLKVFTEEELVERALKEEFEHVSGNDQSLQILEQANSADDQIMNLNKEIISSRISVNGSSNLESSTILNDSSVSLCGTDVSEKKVQQKRSKKRGRCFDRNTRAAELESCYFEKVQQLAKIKQRQDEDKLAARLQSFSGNSKSMEGAIITLDKVVKMQSLRLTTSSVKVKALASKVHVPVYYPEAIICVEIYHQTTSKKVQEFLVLGSQNLTELRDNIYCSTDKLMQAAKKNDVSGDFLQ